MVPECSFQYVNDTLNRTTRTLIRRCCDGGSPHDIPHNLTRIKSEIALYAGAVSYFQRYAETVPPALLGQTSKLVYLDHLGKWVLA